MAYLLCSISNHCCSVLLEKACHTNILTYHVFGSMPRLLHIIFLITPASAAKATRPTQGEWREYKCGSSPAADARACLQLVSNHYLLGHGINIQIKRAKKWRYHRCLEYNLYL